MADIVAAIYPEQVRERVGQTAALLEEGRQRAGLLASCSDPGSSGSRPRPTPCSRGRGRKGSKAEKQQLMVSTWVVGG